MERRAFLATAGGGFVATAGCLERLPGVGPETSFETSARRVDRRIRPT